MEQVHNPMTTWWFLRIHMFVSLLVAVYILSRSHESGDDPWIWIPVITLFPIFGLGAYIIFRIMKNVRDRKWENQKMNVEQGRKFYASRRVSSERELKDRYYNGRARRD